MKFYGLKRLNVLLETIFTKSMNSVTNNIPEKPKITRNNSWTREQEILLFGLLFCWVVYNGTLARVKQGPSAVFVHLSYLYNALQIKYLGEEKFCWRSGKSLQKRFAVIRNKNKNTGRELFSEMVRDFFKGGGADLFSGTILSVEHLGTLNEVDIKQRLTMLQKLQFTLSDVPNDNKQERVNIWRAEENALLFKAVSKYFLKYGSLTAPRGKKEDTRHVWEQVHDIFNLETGSQDWSPNTKRTSEALEKQFKSLKRTHKGRLHLYYLYSFYLDKDKICFEILDEDDISFEILHEDGICLETLDEDDDIFLETLRSFALTF